MVELLLFDKYLIRTDGVRNWMVSQVKDNKEPVVLEDKDGKKVYTNFKNETYHSEFAGCLKEVKRRELITGNIKTLKDMIALIHEIDRKIDDIRDEFFN